MTIQQIYNYFDQIGCVTFSTRAGEETVSRIAHFFAYDEEGLYLRTMMVKPFYHQLIQYKTLSACGMYPDTKVKKDKNNLPIFVPGYTIRISGSVRELTLAEIEEKAKTDPNFNVAVHDIKKYPATRVLVLYKAKGEVYDFDYPMATRNHKILRTPFAYGGATPLVTGLSITDQCIECGACHQACTFKAITPGTPYRISSERCDECGSCYTLCPANAIQFRQV